MVLGLEWESDKVIRVYKLSIGFDFDFLYYWLELVVIDFSEPG